MSKKEKRTFLFLLALVCAGMFAWTAWPYMNPTYPSVHARPASQQTVSFVTQDTYCVNQGDTSWTWDQQMAECTDGTWQVLGGYAQGG